MNYVSLIGRLNILNLKNEIVYQIHGEPAMYHDGKGRTEKNWFTFCCS